MQAWHYTCTVRPTDFYAEGERMHGRLLACVLVQVLIAFAVALALAPAASADSWWRAEAPIASDDADDWRWVSASWYGPGLYGNRTACGQVFTPDHWGLAHKSLPCGTLVHLNFDGRIVFVPVTDRGPFVEGREIDIAQAVARVIGFSGVRPLQMAVR